MRYWVKLVSTFMLFMVMFGILYSAYSGVEAIATIHHFTLYEALYHVSETVWFMVLWTLSMSIGALVLIWMNVPDHTRDPVHEASLHVTSSKK